jgi:hypothetical protein
MTLTCGATTGIQVNGLNKVIFNNPSVGGNGNLTFLYLSGATTVLTAAADVADALTGLPAIQSLITIVNFPSTIA